MSAVTAVLTPGRAALFAVGAASIAVGLVLACSPTQVGGDGHPGGTIPTCPKLTSECPSPQTTYQQTLPVIVQFCDQCHGEGGIEQSQYDYTTYAGIYKNRSEMLTQVNECQMPPYDGGLGPDAFPSAQQREVILSWLACGAPGPDAGSD